MAEGRKPRDDHKGKPVYFKAPKIEGVSATEVAEVLKLFCRSMAEALRAGQKIRIRGLGTFVVRQKPARPGYNFKSGKLLTIRARKVVIFRPSRKLIRQLPEKAGGCSGP